MKNKLVIIFITVAILLIAVLALFYYQQNDLNKQGSIKGIHAEKKDAAVVLSPNTGITESEFTISASGFTPNYQTVEVYWDNSALETSSNTTDDSGDFTATAKVPSDASIGEHIIKIETIALVIAHKIERTKNFAVIQQIMTVDSAYAAVSKRKYKTISDSAKFTVTDPLQASNPTAALPSTAAASTTSTPTLITTQTSAITATSAAEPLSANSTTDQTTTSSPVKIQTSINTTQSASTSTPASTSTTTTNSRVTAIPIIIEDEETESTVTLNKGEIEADGEDKAIVTIALQNEQGDTIEDTIPEISVSGENNTVSEIKREKDNYFATVSSTAPEDKTIKVTAGNIKLPDIKLAFTDSGVKLTNADSLNNKKTSLYLYWWFWLLLGILMALIIYLIIYKSKRK